MVSSIEVCQEQWSPVGPAPELGARIQPASATPRWIRWARLDMSGNSFSPSLPVPAAFPLFLVQGIHFKYGASPSSTLCLLPRLHPLLARAPSLSLHTKFGRLKPLQPFIAWFEYTPTAPLIANEYATQSWVFHQPRPHHRASASMKKRLSKTARTLPLPPMSPIPRSKTLSRAKWARLSIIRPSLGGMYPVKPVFVQYADSNFYFLGKEESS